MKLLFFAVTKHQYRYFHNLSANLPYETKVIFFPSLRFSVEGYKLLRSIDTQSIIETKLKELDAKYNNRFHKALYKRVLLLQIPWIVMVSYKALRDFKPDFLALWNGKKFHQAIALEVAKTLNIKAVFFENGVLPNTTTMDFQGVNATNSVPKEADFYRGLAYNAKALPQNLEVRIAKKEKKKFENRLPERYIFVPFQVAYDTQIIQHSPWIDDMFALFEIIVWLSERLDIPFIIKEHPSDKITDYTILHQQASQNIRFSSHSTQTLIENAMVVMTINSSVAMEALLFKKRVVVLGEAFFAIEGVVKTANSKEKILTILQNLQIWQTDEELLHNFVSYLYYEYLLPTNWRNPDDAHYQAIIKRLEEHAC